MSAALDALREIERLATEEVNQPGTNEDRFRALRRIQAKAKLAVKETEGSAFEVWEDRRREKIAERNEY